MESGDSEWAKKKAGKFLLEESIQVFSLNHSDLQLEAKGQGLGKEVLCHLITQQVIFEIDKTSK